SDEFLHRALNSADENTQVEILDALAFNAHETGRYREAEHLYLDGIERLPGQAAYLHLQLGRHYHSGNRIPEAMQHLNRAAELDLGRNATQAEALRRDLRRTSPGCFFGRW